MRFKRIHGMFDQEILDSQAEHVDDPKAVSVRIPRGHLEEGLNAIVAALEGQDP